MRRALIILVCLACTSAFALNNRSAVSITGSDAASCTVPDPCRTFGVAIAATTPGGEVIALSSGGYGPFTISQSVSVIANAGVHASISPTSGYAITISTAGIRVLLRGLTLTSLGATAGIYPDNFSELTIEACNVTGFTWGVYAHNNLSNYQIYVTGSRFSDNTSYGFYAYSGAFTGKVAIDHCEFKGNYDGVFTTAGIQASISNTVIAGSVANGVVAYAGTTNIESCQVVTGDTGIVAGYAGGIARVSNTVITFNRVGIDVDTSSGGSGSYETRQNNTLRGNTTDISPTAAAHITTFTAW